MKSLKFIAFLTFFLLLHYAGTVYSQNSCSTATKIIYSDSLDAIHYDIHLEDINLTNKTIRGYTEVILTPKVNGLSSIKLELEQLIVDSVKVDQVIKSYSHEGNTLTVFPGSTLGISDTLAVRVYYHGTTFVDPSQCGGFQFSGNYAFNLGVGFNSIPHNLGKAWFPCIDDFRDRALYDVYITVPNSMKATSGGLLQDVTVNTSSARTWHWKTTYSLPTYLISASIGAYSLVTDTYNGIAGQVPITLYCRPTDSLKVEGTFQHLKNILGIYEDHFGPYPFERVGYTATAEGAMEHAANISYPYSGWDGTTSNEWWYAHELSHMWFGDKVTCASAEDMWLNEGWAVWCESLTLEFLYGKDVSTEYLRNKLKNVILNTHVTDDGYYPVYGIPQTITYGSTVYEKGAQVTHTLRNYLGDELFFNGIKAYLQHFAYQPASTCDLRDFLSSYTGVDLDDFFNAWVFSPGFLNFSVGYMQATPSASGYDVKVEVNQKLLETTEYANSNHLEITFLGKNWQQYTDTLIFSGKQGNKTFHVPFEPADAISDLHEKVSDAAIDRIFVIKNTGEIDFSGTYSKVLTNQVTDSVFVRITHNWVAPDAMKVANPAIRLSDARYWKVQGIFNPGFKANGKFFFSKSGLDKNLLTGPNDSIIILYRPDSRGDWMRVPFTRLGTSNIGYLIVDSLAKGEYTLAALDKSYGMAEPCINNKSRLKIYPNPAHEYCTIEVDAPDPSILTVVDSKGSILDKMPFRPGKHELTWSSSSRGPGVYYFHLSTLSGADLSSEKMIFN
ncbi:MAG: M1 family metallopeptidase [Bacteroidetes bacterium]|nr:M1 family metallopeptidase [Bacteroidota bacterium]